MTIAADIHEAVAQVCPIDGVSIGEPDDKTTWTISYGQAATQQQKAAAAEVVRNFDVNATPVPQSVSPRQARLALLGAGLLDQVTAAVNAAGGATLITWDYASSFDRNDPLIIQIGASLNLTSSQIDALFKQAAAL